MERSANLDLINNQNIVNAGVVNHPAASREIQVRARHGAPGALELVELACCAIKWQTPPVKVDPNTLVCWIRIG